ncbi:hypothetical protein [Halostagnicola sp. A-GB9-2]|uniref:hypothetical protein n=1 Tax=Halostagnicola sp. A-GB9-2 TaxID=3048066 RepID=UPI0024C015A7|nr:hypothetical protein [Halostagnicola sp. A-GB9-2]MDJ1432340.1 hypothetical protein [Halostagnicola sp. A-GB9-2]
MIPPGDGPVVGIVQTLEKQRDASSFGALSLLVTKLGVRVTDEGPSLHPECSRRAVPIIAVVQVVPTHHNTPSCRSRISDDLLE